MGKGGRQGTEVKENKITVIFLPCRPMGGVGSSGKIRTFTEKVVILLSRIRQRRSLSRKFGTSCQ